MQNYNDYLAQITGGAITDANDLSSQSLFSTTYTAWLTIVVLADPGVMTWLESVLTDEQLDMFVDGEWTVGLNQNSTDGAPTINFGDGGVFGLDGLFGGVKEDFSWTQGKATQTRYFFDTAQVPNSGQDVSFDYDDLNPVPTTTVWNSSTTADDVKVGDDEGNTIHGGNGDDQLYGRGGDDTLIGNNHNDTLYGQAGNDIIEGNGGNDTIYGGSGNDTIIGGGGADELWGGSGDDNFVYTVTGDSSGANIDTIHDFGNGADTIDLSAIAGITTIQGSLTVVGDLGPNSVGWLESGGETIVYADANGDGNADMEIHLTGTGLGLTNTDFILA